MKKAGRIRAWLIRKLGGELPAGTREKGPEVGVKRTVRRLAAQEGFYIAEHSAVTFEEYMAGARLRCAEKLAGQLLLDDLIGFKVDKVRERVIVTARLEVLDPRGGTKCTD